MNSLYKPLNEEEVMQARFNLLPDGEYDGLVTASIRKNSSTGNTMADMNVKLFDKNGESHDVRDFLIFTDKMLWKIKHFCDSSGQAKEYSNGAFTPELANNQRIRAVVCKQVGGEIPMDKLNGKPFGSKYPDKNVIQDYLPNSMNSVGGNEPFNDVVPF